MDIRLSSEKSLRRSVVVCLLVLGAFASNAFASSNASAAQWQVAGAPLIGAATYTSSSPSGFSLGWEIGTSRIKITASGVESVNSSIFNSNGLATGEEKLRLTGVKTSTPASCAVEGITGKGTIQTESLKTRFIAVGGVTLERFEAANGPTWFTFKLVKGQGTCALAGTYSVAGWAAAEVGGIGTEQIAHGLTFSESIQHAAGAELELGSKPFEFAGSLSETLTGTHGGQPWSAS